MNVKLGTVLTLSAVVAVAASAGTVTASNLIGEQTSVAQSAAPAPEPTAPAERSQAEVVPNAVGVGAGTEMLYVPIAPCRIVDTRKAGGKLAVTAERSFYVKGAVGFEGQGGKAGGCGIPASATGASFSFTTTESTGKGRLNAWPHGTAEPSSTALSYTSANKVTSNPTVGLAKAGAPHVRVHNYDFATHLVVDVTGYYLPQLAAYVASDGTLLDGSSRVVSLQKLGTGYYSVQFDRSIDSCVAVASADIDAVTVAARTIGDRAYLYTYNTAGTAVNYWFNLVVIC